MASLRPASVPARNANRRTPPKLRLNQIVAVAALLAVFLVAVVIGGAIGALVVALLAVAAGILLVLRWRALDPRIRVFRAVAVVIAAAVSVSLMLR